MVGLAAVLLAATDMCLARFSRVAAHTVLALLVVLLGAWTFSRVVRDNMFNRQAAAVEAPLGQLVRKHTSENSVVLVWERSGTIRYYSGRTTLRYDYLDREWLDRAVAWLRERGVHVYAVLDPNHREQCMRRFAGQATLEALDCPVFIYDPAGTALYDLTTLRRRSSRSFSTTAIQEGGLLAIRQSSPRRSFCAERGVGACESWRLAQRLLQLQHGFLADLKCALRRTVQVGNQQHDRRKRQRQNDRDQRIARPVSPN